jgi:hypothetical protein
MGLDEGLGDLGDFGADLSRDTFAEIFDLVRIGARRMSWGQPSASATKVS